MKTLYVSFGKGLVRSGFAHQAVQDQDHVALVVCVEQHLPRPLSTASQRVDVHVEEVAGRVGTRRSRPPHHPCQRLRRNEDWHFVRRVVLEQGCGRAVA